MLESASDVSSPTCWAECLDRTSSVLQKLHFSFSLYWQLVTNSVVLAAELKMPVVPTNSSSLHRICCLLSLTWNHPGLSFHGDCDPFSSSHLLCELVTVTSPMSVFLSLKWGCFHQLGWVVQSPRSQACEGPGMWLIAQKTGLSL